MVKKIHGSSEGITHSIDEDEVNEFSSNINGMLCSDVHLKHLLPLALDGSSLFKACKDGLLLCKLLNSVAPLTIDDRVLNYHQSSAPLSLFHQTENINVAVQSAKSLGCSTVNIGPQDILEGRQHLILGLIWQIIKIGLFAKVFSPLTIRSLCNAIRSCFVFCVRVKKLKIYFGYPQKSFCFVGLITTYSRLLLNAGHQIYPPI